MQSGWETTIWGGIFNYSRGNEPLDPLYVFLVLT
jgi:hypothetical protein